MPEGPEVKIVCEELRQLLKGLHLFSIEYSVKRFKEAGIGDESCIVFPLRFVDVICKGKKLVFVWVNANDQYIYFFSTLHMEGKWLLRECFEEHDVHTHLIMEVGDLIQSKDVKRKTIRVAQKHLLFHETRPFAKFYVTSNRDNIQAALNKLGPDILSSNISFDIWRTEYAKHPRMSLKSILLNQKVFSGIGNYLKSEILYRARLAPDRKISSLTEKELYDLYIAATTTIRQSYEAGGLTISTYWSPTGKKGTFKKLVYGEKFDPEGREVIFKKENSGNGKGSSRNTYWVPGYQV